MTNTVPIGVIPTWEATDRLVKARKTAGLTQDDLATLIGVSPKTIKRHESGASWKRSTVIAIAFATGIDTRWLLGEVGGDPDTTAPDTRGGLPTDQYGILVPLRPRNDRTILARSA